MALENKKIEYNFLLVLIIMVLAMAYFILRPFLYVVIMAGVFAVILKPIYKKMMKLAKQNQGIAAVITILIMIICILIPLAFLAMQILKEATDFYSNIVSNNGLGGAQNFLSNLLGSVKKLVPASWGISLDASQYVKRLINWQLENIGSIFSNAANIMSSLLIFIAALYFLLRDGWKLKKQLIRLSPLNDARDITIFNKLETAIVSVIKGSILVALIQGASLTLAFYLFGIPSPVLWGSLAMITALIPAIGTGLALLSALAFLLLNGQFLAALGLFVWGAASIGFIDNFLGPKFVSRGIQLHPFLVFLSVVGGLIFFGPVGFLLGPLTLSLLFTLLDIYFSYGKDVNEKGD